jgi:FtsH-binding integral membrane protein
VVFIATVFTLVIVVSLTIYASSRKDNDFRFWGGFLYCCLGGLFCASLVLMFVDIPLLHLILCVLYIILFSIFLVWDS